MLHTPLHLIQMAPKKLTSKKARKTTTGEGSNTTTPVEIEFNGHCFEVIKDWSFLKERRVQLAEGEYIEF